MNPLKQYLKANIDLITTRLVEFASIPSISAERAYAPAVRQAAEWVAARMQAVGLRNVRIVDTARHPVVLGDWLDAPGQPTVLIYGHYDVQVVDPLGSWQTPPFEPQVRNGRLYGRGVSDDKGPLLTAIEAVGSHLAVNGRLPVQVKFMLEGEEEIGSPSMEDFLRSHAIDLACDVVLSTDGAMWPPGRPSLSVASRGMASLEVVVQGACKDLHSGRHGGTAPNALIALAQVLGSLRTPEGRITVEGFYDGVAEPTECERAEIAAVPYSEADYCAEMQLKPGFGEPGYSLLERQWVRPTLDVVGMGGGYQGEGIKTVIPASAWAKISCRLVSGQDPHDICEKITRHLHAHCPPGVHLEASIKEGGVPAYRIASDHPGLKIAAAVLQDLYGEAPLVVRIGATLPVTDAFRRHLQADTLFFAFASADEDYHAPNEFFRLQRLEDGLLGWAEFLGRMENMDPAFMKGIKSHDCI